MDPGRLHYNNHQGLVKMIRVARRRIGALLADERARLFSSQSGNSDFFAFSSGRARKRRSRKMKLLKANQERKNADRIDSAKFEDDTRTVKDLLFPNPHKGEDFDDVKIQASAKTWAEYREAVKKTWQAYLSTWDGFTASRGFFVEEKAESKGKEEDSLEKRVVSKRQEVSENVSRNAQVVEEEAIKLRDQIRDKTGIQSKEDLQRVAADAMTLFSNCINGFMTGYRKGRDDEVEKVMREYFQEVKEKINKPKRRKRKRRVID